MDIVEVIRKRQAIRAFKPDPVPQETLRKIMELALLAPSWANTQPWEFAIVTGKPLEEIQKGFIERGAQPPTPDIARPYEFPEPYLSRLSTRNQSREDADRRRILNYRHYGAPAVVYLIIARAFFYQAKGINVWSLYDCGSAVQNMMLLAADYGLGTVVQAQAAAFPDIIRRVLGIPESKLIALAIAIGYPDWNDPVTQKRRGKEPVDSVVKWYGF